MRLADFELMVRRMAADVPPEFLDGVAEITVSPRTVPHPEREEIFTLGECVPLPAGADDGLAGVQSRVVLYHGSFLALARLQEGFDWRGEAWETLTHELRHHLEWRARAPELEAFDQAAEHNFARQDGATFDPLFFLDGERLGEDVYAVDDDVFLDRVVRSVPPQVGIAWQGRGYRVPVPADASLPAFLGVEGVEDAPAGELVLVLRRKPGLLSLLRSSAPFHATVRAEPDPGYVPPTMSSDTSP